MIPVTDRPGRRDRSEHARQLRRALMERVQPGPGPALRASTLVLVLTAAALIAAVFVWIVARQLGSAQ